MRVAVTGASGFVGGAVCRHLRAAGCHVEAFGRRDAAALPPDHLAGATYRRWDVAAGPLPDPPDVDAVVHAAAAVGDTGPFAPAFAVTVRGTGHVLDTFPAGRFVHVSSASVYDPHRPQVLAPESAAPDPRAVRWPGPYGPAKALAERLVRHRRPDAVILRPHAVYGPGDTTLLPRVLAAVRHGLLPLPGRGGQRHALTRVEPLAEACRLAAVRDVPPGAYNITDAEPVVLAAVLVEALAARGLLVRVLPLGRRPALAGAVLAELAHLAGPAGHPPRFTRYAAGHLALERTFDLTRARTLLGWTPPPTDVRDAATW